MAFSGMWSTRFQRPIMPIRGLMLLALTGHGVERATETSDGGWAVESVLQEHPLRCLAADPLRPGGVYAGTERAGILRSDDGGRTWSGHRGRASRDRHSITFH